MPPFGVLPLSLLGLAAATRATCPGWIAPNPAC
jgi:hypothetical protein